MGEAFICRRGAARPAEPYTRPSDWLKRPARVIEEINFLVAIQPNGHNKLAFLFSVDSGAYTVDWGDGTSNEYTSNVQAEHAYTYANIPASTMTSRGYRQVWIKVKPTTTGSKITGMNLQKKPSDVAQSQVFSPILEVYGWVSNFSSVLVVSQGSIIARLTALEVFDVIEDNHTLNDMSYLFNNCNSLQTIFSLNTSNVLYLVNMFLFCYSLKSISLIDTENVADISSLCANCFSLQSIKLLSTLNTTSMQSVFNNCYSLQAVDLDLTAVTLWNVYVFTNNHNLSALRLRNMTVNITAIDIKNTMLNQAALVQVFNDLFDRTATTAGTITITNAYGAAALTVEDRLIATNKNWTIVG